MIMELGTQKYLSMCLSFFYIDQIPQGVVEVDTFEADTSAKTAQLSLSGSPNEKCEGSPKEVSKVKNTEKPSKPQKSSDKDGGFIIRKLPMSAEKVKSDMEIEESKPSEGTSKAEEPKKKRIQFTTLCLNK